ncbi:hypothetical protein CVIRNUC_004902 [Coccomyxa viridis]|uniref:Extracellular protein n=1 Tax=Coccomyxa viridis TaxID=1274662 RepID=A0AAV1I2V7_9CHLO|nr:hypothetical protein CVIRNUC_004902 [Coccomyxa viridis]
MGPRVLLAATAALLCSAISEGRSLLADCPHATSSFFDCKALSGAADSFIVCVNICPSSTDPCAPCQNPAETCSMVDANKTHQASREYNATLNEYLYGKICYSATPPPGTVGAEESNPGLPSVSEPDGGGPTPSYTGKAPPPSRK